MSHSVMVLESQNRFMIKVFYLIKFWVRLDLTFLEKLRVFETKYDHYLQVI